MILRCFFNDSPTLYRWFSEDWRSCCLGTSSHPCLASRFPSLQLAVAGVARRGSTSVKLLVFFDATFACLSLLCYGNDVFFPLLKTVLQSLLKTVLQSLSAAAQRQNLDANKNNSQNTKSPKISQISLPRNL